MPPSSTGGRASRRRGRSAASTPKSTPKSAPKSTPKSERSKRSSSSSSKSASSKSASHRFRSVVVRIPGADLKVLAGDGAAVHVDGRGILTGSGSSWSVPHGELDAEYVRSQLNGEALDGDDGGRGDGEGASGPLPGGTLILRTLDRTKIFACRALSSAGDETYDDGGGAASARVRADRAGEARALDGFVRSLLKIHGRWRAKHRAAADDEWEAMEGRGSGLGRFGAGAAAASISRRGRPPPPRSSSSSRGRVAPAARSRSPAVEFGASSADAYADARADARAEPFRSSLSLSPSRSRPRFARSVYGRRGGGSPGGRSVGSAGRSGYGGRTSSGAAAVRRRLDEFAAGSASPSRSPEKLFASEPPRNATPTRIRRGGERRSGARGKVLFPAAEEFSSDEEDAGAEEKERVADGDGRNRAAVTRGSETDAPVGTGADAEGEPEPDVEDEDEGAAAGAEMADVAREDEEAEDPEPEAEAEEEGDEEPRKLIGRAKLRTKRVGRRLAKAAASTAIARDDDDSDIDFGGSDVDDEKEDEPEPEPEPAPPVMRSKRRSKKRTKKEHDATESMPMPSQTALGEEAEPSNLTCTSPSVPVTDEEETAVDTPAKKDEDNMPESASKGKRTITSFFETVGGGATRDKVGVIKTRSGVGEGREGGAAAKSDTWGSALSRSRLAKPGPSSKCAAEREDADEEKKSDDLLSSSASAAAAVREGERKKSRTSTASAPRSSLFSADDHSTDATVGASLSQDAEEDVRRSNAVAENNAARKKRRLLGRPRIQDRAELCTFSPSSSPPETAGRPFFPTASAQRRPQTPPHSMADAALGPSTSSPVWTSPEGTKRRKPSPIKKSGVAAASSTAVVNPYKTAAKKGDDRPAPAARNRSDDNVAVGLRNLGNTCYLNASLQMLFALPNFVKELARAHDEREREGEDEDDKGERRRRRNVLPLTRSLLEVARSLRILPPEEKRTDGGDRGGDGKSEKDGAPIAVVADPTRLKRAVDSLTSKFAGYEQRDAHEFASDLIDAIHDELRAATGVVAEEEKKDDGGAEESAAKAMAAGASSPLPTNEYFRLDVRVRLTCDSCGYARSKEEMYRHLSIDVGGDDLTSTSSLSTSSSSDWTVEAGLRMFFRPERREIKCEKCDDGRSATQTMEIVSRPRALLLHLKRFALTQQTSPAPIGPPARTPSPKRSAEDGDGGGGADDEGDGAEEKKREEGNGADVDGGSTRKAAPPPAMEMTFRKNKARVSLHETISTDDFRGDGAAAAAAAAGTTGERRRRYRLRGVVRHIGGTASSGHYTAVAVRSCGAGLLVRDGDGGNSAGGGGEGERWVDFDDRVAVPTTAAEVLEDERNQRNAYMMLYELE